MRNVISVVCVFLLVIVVPLSAITNIKLDPIVNKTRDVVVLTFLDKDIKVELGQDASLSGSLNMQVSLNTIMNPPMRVIDGEEMITVGVKVEGGDDVVEKQLKLADLLDNNPHEVELGDYLLVFKHKNIDLVEKGVSGAVAGVGGFSKIHLELEIKYSIKKTLMDGMDALYHKAKDSIQSMMGN